jgi:hypothetical protein
MYLLMLQWVFRISLLFILVACQRFETPLDSLGTQSSFSDVDIPDDFVAPEDETIEDPLENEEISEDEESVVILPPEGEITPGPVQVNLKNTMYFEDNIFTLARGPAWRWRGCQEGMQTLGGYNSDTQCNNAFFHPSFAESLNESFFVCVSDAAKAAGLPQPHRVYIRHLGTYNDRLARNSNRRSNHAYARAWDIVNFNLFDGDGNMSRVSTLLRDYVDEQAIFYDEFRDCWMESLPETCGPGNTEFRGSVGHQASRLGGNSLHNDHLHLSYPLCAGDT